MFLGNVTQDPETYLADLTHVVVHDGVHLVVLGQRIVAGCGGDGRTDLVNINVILGTLIGANPGRETQCLCPLCQTANHFIVSESV